MAVINMKKLQLVALQSDVDRMLEDLMWTGAVEVTNASADLDRSDLPAVTFTSGELARAETELSSIEAAIAELKDYESAPKGLFTKKKRYGRSDYDASDGAVSDALAMASETDKVSSRLKMVVSELNRLSSDRAALVPWTNYDLPLELKGTDRAEIILASYPLTRDVGMLTDRLDSVTDKYELQTVSEDESARYYCLIADKRSADELIRSTLDLGLAKQEISSYGSGTPTEIIKAIDADAAMLGQEREDLIARLKEIARDADKLEFASDVISAKIARLETKQKLICTDSAVIMTGWVPETAVPIVEKQLENVNCAYEFAEPDCDPEDVPVLLKNDRVTSNFESVIEMYSLPQYKTFDPTKIMSVFYFIIFGMMFGDFIYGLILTVGGILMTKLLDLGRETKKLLMVFAICGVSSMIFGILFGSYAGNLLGGLIPPIAFDIVDQPIYFLVLSLAIGAVHLLVGMGIRFYVLCKEKQFFRAIVEVGSWYIIFAGIALAVLVNTTAGIITAGVGAAIIILFKENTKNPIMRILKGLLGLYDIVNFASDLLSYSRIMALGMSSAIIAMVVNTLAQMPGKSPVGIVIMILILLLGHIINIALNILGTYVHTSRLQYIEFFGKFYVDGGMRFRPLALAPKYTRIQE